LLAEQADQVLRHTNALESRRNQGHGAMRVGRLLNSVISPFGFEVRRKARNVTDMALSQGQPSILRAGLNPLRDYFDRHRTGPGIWKFEHYFQVYHRHLSPFRDRPVHILEIGVYSGGSLFMWADYFGPKAIIYGVDIEPSCKVYESNQVRICIGDQGSQAFWRDFKTTAPLIDVVIDDASHRPDHQILSFKELFPHLRAGGVYICEDIVRLKPYNAFTAYANEIADALNDIKVVNHSDPKRPFLKANEFQKYVECIAFYPFLAVFTKRIDPIEELAFPKRGTEWQPFLG
jgi:hypothetical protein